jgi:hypothetical protein
VGLNVDTALFTITVAATAEEAQQLLQRVFQLEQVWWVGQPAPPCHPAATRPSVRLAKGGGWCCLPGTEVPCRGPFTWTGPPHRGHIN